MNLLDILANGLLNASGWEIAGYTLLMTHLSIITVTVYLHRAMAHRAMDMHPALAHFFRFWAWFTTATVTREWVSVHRKHHAKCETDEDPHSPVVKGLKTVLLTGAELYKTEASNEETTTRYGKGCPDDWMERNLYSKFKLLGIFTLLALNIAMFGAIGITVWAIQMLWMPFHAAGVINGLGHWFGYRNFECADAATNISPVGLWIGGEELHNNHHTYPNSAKLSVKPWEFDIGWGYIQLFKKLGLVKNVRQGPVVHVNKQKSMLDIDAVMAAANNRFQIMAKFRKRVIKPVVAEQRQQACEETMPLMKRAKRLLTREQSLLSEKHQQQLETLLEKNEMMHKLYEMKQDLQKVWKKRSASSEELIHALEDWCKRAEESGIKALQEFADSLKYYSMQKTA